MAVARRPLLAFFLAAAALYAGVNFVVPPTSISASARTTQQLNGAMLGIPATLMLPEASHATKTYTGLFDVLTDKEASYALGIEWLTWNTVYIGLALFCAGAIFVFPILYSVLLPPPSTVEDMVD